MMRLPLSWMRVVLPHAGAVTVCIVTEMMIELTHLFVLWQWGNADEQVFRGTRLGWLTIWAAVYGTYRVSAFHPAVLPEYREWLESTPWTADKPLPGGPLHLVPQDLVVIVALVALTRVTSIDVLYLPLMFLLTHLLALGILARLTGEWALAYLMGFGLGLVAYLGRQPELALIAASACYLIGWESIRRSLRRFPWELPWQLEVASLLASATWTQIVEEEKRRRIGWPYDQLAPRVPKLWVPYHDGICLSLLAGWWWFVVLSVLPDEPRLAVATFSIIVMFVLALVRIGCYCSSYHPPISFWGRLWTLRWIIPSYDQIFVAPILAVLIAFAGQVFAVLACFDRPANMNNPILIVPVWPVWVGCILSAATITVSLFLLLVAGPHLERWRLVARHRIVFDLGQTFGKQKNDEFLEL